MKTGKTLLLMATILNGSMLSASTPVKIIKTFDEKVFNINRHNKISNLFGEIKFSNLKQIIENKTLVRDADNVKVFFYWMKRSTGEQLDLEVRGNISDELKEIISEALKSKLNILLGKTLASYLGSDELTYSGSSIQAIDLNAAESNERILNFQNNKLQIIERKPSGTITTNYSFIEHKSGKIIQSIEQTAFEGIQATETKSKMSYSNTLGMPILNKIETSLEQRLFRTTEDDLEINRQILEIIEFADLEMNTDKVLSWFSRK